MPNGKEKNRKGLYEYKTIRFCYVTGMQSVRILKRAKRRLVHFFQPLRELCARFYHSAIQTKGKELQEEAVRIKKGFKIAKKRISSAKQEGKASYVTECLRVTGKSMVRHRKLLLHICNIAAPIAAVVVLLFTVHYWMNQNFGLMLAYGDENIGAIQSEQTFEQASDLVNQRLISDAIESKSIGISPKYQLAIMDETEYITPISLCDRLIEKSGGVIEEASGLYVDGQLVAAVKSNADLSYLLQDMLNEARGEEQEGKASFVQNVESITGLYSSGVIISSEEMKNRLAGTKKVVYTVQSGETAETIADKLEVSQDKITDLQGTEVQELSVGDKIQVEEDTTPLLKVKVVKQETYENAIPFKTVTVKDDEKDTDYTQVTQEGEEGQEICVDEITYIDGEEVSRSTVSRTVVKEAVDKNITVGTKKKEAVNNSGVASGSMMWPVPYTHRVMSNYQMRWGKMHNGIDISSSGIRGQAIVAADGGTVKYVKLHNYGYGYHLMIDHGNGMSTMYAHCNSISVQPGQKVSKGQVIATVGSTGDSTGNHLHFEVYQNGSRVNPLDYVK